MTITPNNTPELPYLHVFHTVCVEASFTAAARRLGCSQPAVSYQVRTLERAMKVTLFERGGRRLLLTPDGERLRALCERLFSELAQMRTAPLPRVGTLRLCSASGFGRYVLVPALRALFGDGDGLELRVWFDAADVILRRLVAGECDAAFVYAPGVSSRLRYQPVFDEQLVLIAPPSRARAANLATLESLERHAFVTYQEGDYVFGRWFDSTFGRQPSGIMSVAHFSELEEVVEWVGNGAGISIVPRDAVEGTRVQRPPRIVASPGPCLNQVFMVTRSASVVLPELNRIAEWLRAGGSQQLPSAESERSRPARIYKTPSSAASYGRSPKRGP